MVCRLICDCAKFTFYLHLRHSSALYHTTSREYDRIEQVKAFVPLALHFAISLLLLLAFDCKFATSSTSCASSTHPSLLLFEKDTSSFRSETSIAMRILTHVLALLVLLDSPSALTAAKKHRHQNHAAAAAADHDRALQDVDAVAESIDYNDLDAVAIATPPEAEVATPTLDCIQCTNIPTKHMLSTQIMCSTYSYAFERRCGTEVGWWGRDGNPEYCQYSCWMNGAPYASQRGAPCCERDDVDDAILANILAEPAVVEEEEEEEEGLLHFTTTGGVIDLKAPIAAEKVHTSDGTDIPDINDEVLKEIAAEELAIVEDVVDELESETDEPTMIPATDDPTMLPATATDEPSLAPRRLILPSLPRPHSTLLMARSLCPNTP